MNSSIIRLNIKAFKSGEPNTPNHMAHGKWHMEYERNNVDAEMIESWKRIA